VKRLILCAALGLAACTDEELPAPEVEEVEMTAEDQALFEGLGFQTTAEANAAAEQEITEENADEVYQRLLDEISNDG